MLAIRIAEGWFGNGPSRVAVSPAIANRSGSADVDSDDEGLHAQEVLSCLPAC